MSEDEIKQLFDNKIGQCIDTGYHNWDGKCFTVCRKIVVYKNKQYCITCDATKNYALELEELYKES